MSIGEKWLCLMLVIVIVCGLCGTCAATECIIKQQPDPNHHFLMRWVVPYPKKVRCKCTDIQFERRQRKCTGRYDISMPAAMNHFYTKEPLLLVNSESISDLLDLLECSKDTDNSGNVSKRGEIATTNAPPSSKDTGPGDMIATTTKPSTSKVTSPGDDIATTNKPSTSKDTLQDDGIVTTYKPSTRKDSSQDDEIAATNDLSTSNDTSQGNEITTTNKPSSTIATTKKPSTSKDVSQVGKIVTTTPPSSSKDMLQGSDVTARLACPVDFFFQDSCYKVYSSQKDKFSAAEACIEYGSHLVDITTQEEQDYLTSILSRDNSDNVWIGLSSVADNEPLYWSDNSPLSFTAWDDLGRNQGTRCIRMTRDYNYRWGDKGCTYSYGYICEFEYK